jgi:ubiquinone/menaquinone biosynthesis C-methylase UbiE
MQEDVFLHPNDHKRKKDWLKILSFMDKNLDYSKINKTIDLGGGLGDITYHILKHNESADAICSDTDERLLQMAEKRHPKLKTMTLDINKKMPFDDNSMDLVSCLGTLHYYYITDPEKVFADIVRISKKYILVDFLYKYRLWYFLLKVRYPKYNPRRYTATEIDKLIKKHNLKIIDRVGTRNPFGKIFPSMGRTTIFLLEK